ncbi:acyl--CoA ligase [Alkalihalophilus marmarensis]|jgi:acyl-CoA synthetase (AMP-forming)/AMP-acid ligase II|uniref:Acyl-CoA synthetase (AMP-forming)/AMP-acid ligase II n=1 Tax=Alkalihalophilus marmarensis DSM 21297 TaxID=1188261 RepID=U6SSB6_9BACI|nr:class I adenylate-forming enzyme family protein [Alkalihalophilus marmarensis]ERN54599.1 hypothetical protein A33I_04450 [Alkalihalophilus marmarensis DSM 21297]MCM3488863.1 acyl--CoA ligase [Alkalihalophilus marmarensis]
MLEEQILFDRRVKVYSKRPKNISEMLKECVSKYPEREAIVMGEFRQNYSELGATVESLAAHLYVDFHVRKGERVAVLLNNCPEFLHITLACARIGAIVVPLNNRLSHTELSYMLRHSGTKLLFTEEKMKEVVKKVVKNELSSMKIEIKYINRQGEKGCTFVDLPFQQTINYKMINETDPLFIMFTSGTTGTPKGAVGSHVGIIHSALNYKYVLKANEPVRTIIAVPLFHVTGLIGQFFYMLAVGGTSILLERYQNESFIKTMEKEQATFLFNVPTIYVMMMTHPLFSKITKSSIEVIAYGGAPMSYETIEQLRSHFPGVQLHNAYGATETSSPTTIMPVEYPDEKLNSVGKPVPVADVKVINSKGAEVHEGEVGELYIKGPMVVEGYWRNPEAKANSFKDGYWKSGDMAKVDEHGFVYIMDRKKDIINRGGEKIYSVEVENILYGHHSVLEAAVVGVPDQLFGEQVKAYIVPKPHVSLDQEDILLYLNEKLADYKIPKYIEFINELPRNPSGKILKSQLAISKDK